jgi:NAD(P)-dependent dehydrogenase (short-subunit alcohol dehydrogenase family)
MEKLRGAFATVVGENLLLEPLDVTIEAEATRATEAAVARFGRIDVLVNNAGYSLLGNLEEFTLETITPVVVARLAELRANAELSKAAGGTFTPAGLGS